MVCHHLHCTVNLFSFLFTFPSNNTKATNSVSNFRFPLITGSLIHLFSWTAGCDIRMKVYSVGACDGKSGEKHWWTSAFSTISVFLLRCCLVLIVCVCVRLVIDYLPNNDDFSVVASFIKYYYFFCPVAASCFNCSVFCVCACALIFLFVFITHRCVYD